MCRFNVVWDNRDSENGELEDFKLLYFLQDDTIAIKVIHSMCYIKTYGYTGILSRIDYEYIHSLLSTIKVLVYITIAIVCKSEKIFKLRQLIIKMEKLFNKCHNFQIN